MGGSLGGVGGGEAPRAVRNSEILTAIKPDANSICLTCRRASCAVEFAVLLSSGCTNDKTMSRQIDGLLRCEGGKETQTKQEVMHWLNAGLQKQIPSST